MHSKKLLQYFSLVFVLSIPFWVLGGITEAQLLPGLPIGSLMFVCPVVAATMLTYRAMGWSGVATLLARSWDFDKIKSKLWWASMVLLMPAVTVFSHCLMIWRGYSPPFQPFFPLTVIIVATGFFFAGLCEELGWSGYALDRMQKNWGVLPASLAVGTIWAIWHFIPLIEVHRSAAWIAWWSLGTVSLRVIMVWLYNNTRGSVFAVALFHAMFNICWILAPNYYDPKISGITLALIAAIVTTLCRMGQHGLSVRES